MKKLIALAAAAMMLLSLYRLRQGSLLLTMIMTPKNHHLYGGRL